MRLFRAHRRTKAVLAVAGALLLLGSSASAHHATSTTTLSNYQTNAYPNVTGTTQYGADEPATGETQLPTGWLVAHQVSSPATPISPIPADEEQIGSGTATARWVHLFCGTGNTNFTITWEADMTGAPTNAVAHATITASGIFTTQAWIVRNGTNDYDIEIPEFPTWTVCSSTTDGLTTMTLNGTTGNGNKVAQNPSTAGDYTGTGSYTDTNGGNHTTNGNTITITP